LPKNNKVVRIVYEITLAGKRPVNTFKTEGNLIDLVGYLHRNSLNFNDLVKIIKTEHTVIQHEDSFERFVEIVDITDKVIKDTIPKVLGKRAEKLNFSKIEKI